MRINGFADYPLSKGQRFALIHAITMVQDYCHAMKSPTF